VFSAIHNLYYFKGRMIQHGTWGGGGGCGGGREKQLKRRIKSNYWNV